MGRMKSASSNEAARAKVTVLGICAKNSPVLPVIISMGINARMVVSAELITGSMTSDVPSMTAIFLDFPIWICLKMFSMIMTASSTMIPVTSTNAKRLMVFRDTLLMCMMMMVQRKANGMPIAVSMAFLKPRLIQRIMSTSPIPRIRLPLRVLTESLISMVESLVNTIRMSSFL